MLWLHYFTDGQKIAKRISSQINKETKKLKKLVLDYNRDSLLPEMTIQTALNPDETVESDVCSTITQLQISTEAKNDLVHAYLKKVRSSEEIDILKNEVKYSLDYLQEKQQCIKSCCAHLCTSDDAFSRGAYNLLTHLLWRLELCTFPVEEACKLADATCKHNTDYSTDIDISSSCSSESDTDE